jgi:hypothetical protein
MNGNTLVSQTPTSPESVNPVWQVASIDDFDGDKKSDFVWQNTVTGQVYLWFMDRSTLIGEISWIDAGDWRVAATGDLNGDGRADIVWMDPYTGRLRASLLNGTTFLSEADLTPNAVDPSWRIAGASDLNRDGKADLVWQNSESGALAYWSMNGLSVTGSGSLAPAAVNVTWQIRAVEDFDNDGHTDLVFQHASSGQLYIWYLNGTTLTRHSYINPSTVASGWRVVGGK